MTDIYKDLVIQAVQTKSKVYITDKINAGSYHTSKLTNLLYDGKTPKPTFLKDWFELDSIPKLIQKTVSQPNINYRFELIEDSSEDLPGININELPKVMPREEVMEEIDGSCEWKADLRHLRSLYTLVSDPQDPVLEKLDLEIKIIMNTDCDVNQDGFSYDIEGANWREKSKATEENVINQKMDRIVFPEIVLPVRPSKLSSEISYKIVREHVKANINPTSAEITSDYDFCFTVKKRILLKEPYMNKREILTARGKSYRNRRYRENFVKDRLVECFEMTHAGQRYNNYTVLKGFEGKTHEDLKKNIDKYLEDLMKIINEPLIECPTCDGCGVVEKK